MDSFRQAIANDPVLANSDATRLAVAEGVPQARSALLPQVNGTLSLVQAHGGPATGGTTIDSNGNILPTSGGNASRDRNLSGQLSQSIFNLSSIADLRAAHSIDDAQQETYQAALQNLYVRVAQAYFNVLNAEDQLDINKAYEDGYKQEFDQTSARFKNGLAMSADMNQAQAFYQFIKTQRISSEDQLKDSRRALEQITGKPCGTLKRLRDDMSLSLPVPNDPKAWADLAEGTNPTVLSARYTVKADEHRITSARAGHLPNLSAGVTYSKDGNWQDHVAGTGAYQRGTTTVGLTLTIPVFSGGYTQSKVREAIYQRDADSDTLEGQRRQAIRDVYNYFNQVVDGVEALKAAQDSVGAAEKSLTSFKAGYEIGTQPLYAVVQAIEILAESRSTYAQQRYQFVLNKLLLKQSAGTINVHDLEDVNGLLQ
jgi:outer membrane protein